MANITLINSLPGLATYIPNEFIDNYMTEANGEYVKIYLYLLRCMGKPDCDFSLSKVADHFDYTEKDVSRALKYWEKVQLLRLEYDSEDNLSGICVLPGQPVTPARSTTDSVESMPVDAPEAEKEVQAPTADDIKLFKEREDIQELIFLTETYLGRTINQSDLNFIFCWYDQLHFSSDLIEFLIENCIAKGHPSLHYMQKVAEDWYSKNIHTPEEAKQLVSQNSESLFMQS